MSFWVVGVAWGGGILFSLCNYLMLTESFIYCVILCSESLHNVHKMIILFNPYSRDTNLYKKLFVKESVNK